MRPEHCIVGALALSPVALGVNIFVSHFSGTISTLSLTTSNNGVNYALAANSSLTLGSPAQPSWLTFNSTTRTLWVSDEYWGSASIFTVNASPNGSLQQASKTPAAVNGAVASGQYGGGKFLASAHYSPSSISMYKLPLSSNPTAFQTIKLTQNGKGPNPRQDVPHPHAAFTDPTGNYLLVPDLGADQVRVFSFDKSSGFLTACPSYSARPGSGPRHGVFFRNQFLYVANELANTVDAVKVTYASGTGCPSFSHIQTLTTLPNNQTLPSGTKVAEIRVKDNFLYVSNRRDQSFNPNDSIASYALGTNGSMQFLSLTNAGGYYPRTFEVNKRGDLVVIGGQTSANVVVVRRNVTTGVLGQQVASLRVGSTGTAESENGISAVLWDE